MEKRGFVLIVRRSLKSIVLYDSFWGFCMTQILLIEKYIILLDNQYRCFMLRCLYKAQPLGVRAAGIIWGQLT